MPAEPSFTEIVGRDDELAVIRMLVDSLSPFPPVQVLEIAGPAGIGKSRLLQYAMTRASDHGASVHFVQAARPEQDLQFAHLALLMEDMLVGLAQQELIDPYDIADLALAFPALRSFVTPESATGQLDMRLICHATARAVEAAARQGAGLLLAIDDQQWIDDSSWYVLNYLIRHCEGNPVLVVCAARSGDKGQVRPSSSGLDESAIEVLELRPLDRASAELLIADAIASSRPLILEVANGNPFYLTQLAANHLGLLNESGYADSVDLHRDIDLHLDVEYPRAVTVAILDELADVSERARNLAYAIAVTGDSVAIELPLALTGLDGPSAIRGLDELIAAQFVVPAGVARSFQFRHPVIAGVVYHSVPAGIRIGLHRAAAKKLAEDGSDVVAVARHLERSAEVGDLDAIGTIEAAVAQSSIGSPATAARLLASAIRLIPTGEQSLPHLLRLVSQRLECLIRQGRYEFALAEADRAIALAGNDIRAVALFTTARSTVEIWLDRHETTLADFQRLLGQLPESAAFERMLMNSSMMFHSGIAQDVEAMRAYGAQACEMAEGMGLWIWLFNFKSGMAYMEMWNGNLRNSQERVHEARRILDRLSPSELQAVPDGLILFVGVLQQFSSRELMSFVRLGTDLSVAAGNRVQECRYGLLAESRLTAAGKLGAAAELLADLEQLAHSVGYQQGIGMVLARQSVVAALAGDWASSNRARNKIPAGLLEQRPDLNYSALTIEMTTIRVSLAYVHILAGRPVECKNTLCILLRSGMSNNTTLPIVYELMCLAELQEGNVAEARSWAEKIVEIANNDELVRAQLCGQRALAAVAVAEGDFELASVAALSAIDIANELDAIIEVVQARIIYSRALMGGGRGDEATLVAQFALAEAESCGAFRLAEEASKQLRELGVRSGKRSGRKRTGTRSLTMREREVAVMAATGFSNQEIAQQLFLSRRTVDSHLRRIFTKLEVKSRVELAHKLDRRKRPL